MLCQAFLSCFLFPGFSKYSVVQCEDSCLFIRGFITLLCNKRTAIIESLTSVHEITGED